MAVTTAVSDFFMSLYELFTSVFTAAYSLFHSVFTAIFNFIGGLLTLAGDVAGGVIDIAGGVGKFVLGNIIVVSIGAAGVFAFLRYTPQGRQLTAGRKTS